MAVDEALLEHVAGGDAAIWLRFYQWHEPTLSLGYFQPYSRWRSHVRGECTVVRRQTGGGAILHDHELTYSLVLPPGHPLGRRPEDLYLQIHEALLAALRRFQVAAELWTDRAPARHNEPYLCFQRRAAGDVVIRTAAAPPGSAAAARSDPGAADTPPKWHHKICGSAQRRRRGALLVHGSLLLRASEAAPQILGIEEVARIRLSPEEVRVAWLEELVPILGRTPIPVSRLPAELRRTARRTEQDRFLAEAWTGRR